MNPIDKFQNPKTKFGKYLLNLFLAWDQTWNARTGGDPDETISSRLGKKEKAGKLRGPARILARLLNRLDPKHCADAIEPDEGKDALENFKPEAKS
jgi:hypothetical protein